MAAKAPSKAKTTPIVQSDVVVRQIPGIDFPFEQRPLSFFGKNELLSLVTSVLDDAMSRGIDLRGLFASFEMSRDQINRLAKGDAANLNEVPLMQNMGHLLMRVFSVAPQYLPELYMIALNVPHAARPGVRDVLMEIDDELGFDILNTFVRQNAVSLRDFTGHWIELGRSALAQIRTPEAMEKAAAEAEAPADET